MNIIAIEHLKKYYGEVKAVDDISFTVESGAFFAFLGVNGAGKSTTISVLCGKASPTAGSVLIGGRQAGKRANGELGVVFQDSVLDRSLSVRDNLRYRASLYGIFGKAFESRLAFLTQLFRLEELLPRAVGKLSGGQRRRVDVARALVHGPRILILDEPTTGLDPQTRKSLWEAIHSLRKVRNMTVFLTTHYMEEAADADRVVIIDGGKLLADDTPLGLKDAYAHDRVTLYRVREEELADFPLPYERVGDAFRIYLKDTAQATQLILRYPALFRDYEIEKGGMDDVFLAVTGKRAGGQI